MFFIAGTVRRYRLYLLYILHHTVCNSYYTPVREYRIYYPSTSAVNAILQSDGRVVTGLSPNKCSDKFAGEDSKASRSSCSNIYPLQITSKSTRSISEYLLVSMNKSNSVEKVQSG